MSAYEVLCWDSLCLSAPTSYIRYHQGVNIPCNFVASGDSVMSGEEAPLADLTSINFASLCSRSFIWVNIIISLPIWGTLFSELLLSLVKDLPKQCWEQYYSTLLWLGPDTLRRFLPTFQNSISKNISIKWIGFGEQDGSTQVLILWTHYMLKASNAISRQVQLYCVMVYLLCAQCPALIQLMGFHLRHLYQGKI